MSAPKPSGRPREGLRSGNGGPRSDAFTGGRLDLAGMSNAEANRHLRERVWYRPTVTSVTFHSDPGDPYIRPTEGATNHAMNAELRAAADRLLGR